MEKIDEREKCDYCESFERIPQEEREFLEGFMGMAYRWRIRNGGNGFESFSGCEEGACFEKKILLGWSPALLGAYGEIVGTAKWWTTQRKNSWYNELIRIWEARQVNCPPATLEYDEEGQIIDFAEDNPERFVPLIPPCPMKPKQDPEEFLLAKEDFVKVGSLLKEIEDSPLKYVREYQLIITWLIFEGINDNPVIAQRLGIEQNQAKVLKHQAKRRFIKVAAESHPELFKKPKFHGNQAKVDNLLKEINDLPFQHSRKYQLILMWLIFERINDNEVIAQRLGIEQNEAKVLKYRAKRLFIQVAAKKYPELLEKQKIYEGEETEEHVFERSTVEERRAIYRTHTPEEIEPGKVKIWKGEEAERYLEQLKLKSKKTNLS